jgi:hypothetical protein
MKKAETRPLPGVEPDYCKQDTPLLDLEHTPPLLDEPDRDTPERPTRTEDGRIVGDGSVTVRKTSEQPPAFSVPARRQGPLTAPWRKAVSGNDCPTGPHAVAYALSVMRGETFFCAATEARTPVAPPCRQLACLPKYWRGQAPYAFYGIPAKALAIYGIPAEAIHEAAALFGAAKQASVEAWVEYHQPKDMARASLPPPVDLIITRPRIFRCCSICTGLYRWWMVPVATAIRPTGRLLNQEKAPQKRGEGIATRVNSYQRGTLGAVPRPKKKPRPGPGLQEFLPSREGL